MFSFIDKQYDILINEVVAPIKLILPCAGLSNIPFVEKMVRKIFNGVKVSKLENAVVSGAAIVAAMQSGNLHKKIEHFKFSDIAPMSLGTATSGEDMSILIPRLDKVRFFLSEVF